MAWSTRELAGLAGTTVNTVRHYHRLGLLPEPDRELNGYKQYGVTDLVRLLRIRRLADLGVPLSKIGQVSAGGENGADTLRQVDADLAVGMDRLRRAREDIAAILSEGAPADGPSGFEGVAASLSDVDGSFIHIFTQLYDENAMSDLRRMVEDDTGEGSVTDALNSLAPDADENVRQELVERLAQVLAADMVRYPWLRDPASRLTTSERVAQQTYVEAVAALYNPAQLDVLHRASVLANAQFAPADEDGPHTP